MIDITSANGVRYMKSNKLKARHGFATRIGGLSKNEHTKSLNLAFGRGDEREIVLQNLSLFADAVGFDAHSIVSASQIHSADVRVVTEEDTGQGCRPVKAVAQKRTRVGFQRTRNTPSGDPGSSPSIIAVRLEH